MPKPEKPFNKILMTHGKLRLYLQIGDDALEGQTREEFISDVAECFQYLIDFRNIVNSMASLEMPPADAAKMHSE